MGTARELRLLVFGLLLPVVGVAGTFNVTTHHYDNFRTGWNPQETTLTASNVTQNSFGVIATVTLNDQVDAQPLVLGTTVYVATESNTVYAINATTGSVITTRQLEAAVPISQIKGGACNNNGPNIGINSTPVIDTANNWLYVVTATMVSGVLTYHLHQLSLTNNSLQDVAVALTLNQADGDTLNRQRSALTLFNGGVLIPFASFCDSGPSVGYIVYASMTDAPEAQTLFGTSIYSLASIWMSGYGPVYNTSGSLNYVYFSTGNGEAVGQQGPPSTNMPDSFVNLLATISSGSLNLSLSAFETPDTSIVGEDEDFGAGGVMLIPSGGPTSIGLSTTPQFIVGAGKRGELYVYKPALGIGSEVQEVDLGGDCHCGESYFSGASGKGYVVTSAGSTLGLYSVSSSGLSLVTQTSVPGKAYGDASFNTSVSSNGTVSGSGVIWAVSGPDTCFDISLYAYNAANLELLFSAPVGVWSNVGGNANIIPVVSNGYVYVASNSRLTILGHGTPPAPASISADFNTDCPRALVSWSASSGATYYKLYSTSGNPADWCPVTAGVLYSGASTSVGVKVNLGLQYAFGAVACNTVGCSTPPNGPARGTRPSQCP
jgi:hypothetical protein